MPRVLGRCRVVFSDTVVDPFEASGELMKFPSRVVCALLLSITGYISTASAQIPPLLTPVSYSVPGASMAVLADVNGDGILDIITANGFVFTGSGVSVLLGKGDGSFQPARAIVAGGNPSWVLVGDFNHDGKADIAIANEPDVNFPLSPPTVGGPPPNSVSILLGNGDGTFRPSIDTPTLGALRMVAADFNGDGLLDLAVTTGESSPVQILLGKGDGTFIVSNTAVNGLNGDIAVGDFNHDGRQDLLTNGVELLGNGDGTFSFGPPPPGAGILADFNGDGILDLAGLGTNGGGRNPVSFFGETNFGLTDGAWGPAVMSIFTGYGNLVAADFNGDGKLDIFGPGWLNPSPANQLIGGLFLGHGDGTFTQASAGFGFRGFTASGSAFPVFAAAGDLDRNGSPDLVIADGNGVLVALNTSGHPPLLAKITTNTTFVIGGTATVTATVSLGGPAAAGNALITLTSSNPVVFFPNGNTVVIPAGSQSATFSIVTRAVAAATAVTISASSNSITQAAPLTLLAPVSIASVSIAPSSLFGMFGGNPAAGTVTLSGPAADGGALVSLSNPNPAALSVPATVTVAPGAATASFPVGAQVVTADTPVAVSGSFKGIPRTGMVTVRKELATIAVTKAEYVVKQSLLSLEATSKDRVGLLQVFNPATGALIGTIPLVNVGKFVGQLSVHGALASVALQSNVGGLATAPVSQK
jgi:hypothetical protein